MAAETRNGRAENRLVPRPICRSVMPGSTASFRIRAEGTDISSLHVVPCAASEAFRIRLAGAGLEAPVRGGEEARNHVELLETSRWLVGLFVAASIAGLALIGFSATHSGWTWILPFILGVFIALLGVVSLLFFGWGHFAGLPFHFTPENEPPPPGVPLGRRRRTA